MKGFEDHLVDPTMIEPMMRAGVAGYAPFCSARPLDHDGSAGQEVAAAFGDSQSWAAGVEKLVPLISTGGVQMPIGSTTVGWRRRGQSKGQSSRG